MRIAVVVPAYNEADLVADTIAALAAQDDRDFFVVVTDNASTDGTGDVVREAARLHGLEVTVVDEPQKGTGAAADTAIRHAIDQGATHILRTDADAVPSPGWVAAGRRAFADGWDLITGPLLPRTDDLPVGRVEAAVLPWVVRVAHAFGVVRPSNLGRRFKTRYVMCVGANLGVSAEAYLRAGGFPRTAIEDVHEDHELVNRIRLFSSRIRRVDDLSVRASVRRLRAYGLVGILRWYVDQSGGNGVVDVRAADLPRGRVFASRDAATRREAALLQAAHPGIASVVDRLMAKHPVRRIPGLGVLVADPAAARQVLMDGEHFAKTGPGSSGALWTPVLGERVLFNMDGPEHLELRRSIGDLFTPRMVQGVLERAAQPLMDEAVAKLRAGSPLDVAQLGLDVAASVIADILGLDEGRLTVIDTSARVEELISWRTRQLSPVQVRRASELVAVVGDAALRAYEESREGTVMARLRQRGVSADDARSLAIALFLSGTSTVSAGLPRIVDALADRGALRPGGWTASGYELDRVITEGLRLTSPSLATLRRTVATADVAGVTARPGDRVLILLWWAMRLDGGFDPTRPPPASMRQLWFGAGQHYCMGMPLAVGELTLMVRALVEFADQHGLRVSGRVPARGVLIPRYQHFTVEAG